MLLNLSNHPAERWTQRQREEAERQYGDITDLPFPLIDPDWGRDRVESLAEEYAIRIRQTKTTAVHLMGEMTFTYALVQKLRAAGIPCVASTTRRNVEEKDGKKIVEFEFIRFRSYF